MEHGGNVWDALTPGDWLDFSANLRPEGMPDWVQRTMERALADARYYPDRAMRAARRGLASYAGVEEAFLLPTAGGAAAIDLCVASARGRVLTYPPAFGEYAARARAQGRIHAAVRGDIVSGELRPGDARRNAERRERLFRGLCALGARVLPSQANFLLADFGRDMTEMASALRRRRILVRTCESFGLGPGVWRLAVRTDEENERLLAALSKCLGCGEEGLCAENR